MRRSIRLTVIMAAAVIFMFSIVLSGQPLKLRLATPMQISPKNNSHFTHYPRKLTLRWRGVRKASSYDVEIDCLHCRQSGQWNSQNGPAWKTAKVKKTAYSFTFVGDNKGRWRVRASRGHLKSSWSPWWYFDFDTSGSSSGTDEERSSVVGTQITARPPQLAIKPPDKFMLDFKDAYLVFSNPHKSIQIAAQNTVLSYGSDWEKCQLKPYLYHIRQKFWKGFFWKVNTSRKQVYEITGGTFCKISPGTSKTLNIKVDVVGGSDTTPPDRFMLRFKEAHLVYLVSSKTLQLITGNKVLSYCQDFQKCNLTASVYHLKENFWKGFYWKINTMQKKVWKINGTFCKPSTGGTLLNIGVRVFY